MRHSFQTVQYSPYMGCEVPLIEVLDGAAAAGFLAVGLDLWSVEAYLADGHGRDLRSVAGLLEERGLVCTDVLAIIFSQDLDETLEHARVLTTLATATGATVCGGGPAWNIADPLAPAVRTIFGRACEVFADAGIRIAVECIPFTPLDTVAKALELCSDVGPERAGLLLDNWHVELGGQRSAAERLTAEAVALVQVADTRLPVPVTRESARNLRVLPGDGDLDVRWFAELLTRIGFDGVISPEILSPDVRSSSPASFARQARASLGRYFAAPPS